MENKIPTAEEFFNNKEIFGSMEERLSQYAIEFAKLHVEAQAKAIVNNINPETGKYIISGKEQILNAYPLTLIK